MAPVITGNWRPSKCDRSIDWCTYSHFAADSLRLASFNFFLVSSPRRFYFGIIGDEGISAIQSHPRSPILVPIESAYVTSY